MKAKDISDFFIVCPLGFEEELSEELREFWPFLLAENSRAHSIPLQYEIHKGGIALSCPLILGLQINFFSRLAVRILLRLDEFKVRDLAKMQRKFSEIPLDSFFKGSFQLKIAASESRLNNEKKIYEIATKSWKGKIVEDSEQSIFIRMSDDICSVSLDTSGEALFKRGKKQAVGTAPLRENLAAWCLRTLKHGRSLVDLAEVELVDPMAGSGTMILEAYDFLNPNLTRSYAFQSWKATPALLTAKALGGNYQAFPQRVFSKLIAKDIDPEQMQALKNNLRQSEAEVFQEDLFGSKAVGCARRWLICNPPYGERVERKWQWQDLLSQMQKVYQPERLGVLVPKAQLSQVPSKIANLTLKESRSLSHGGLAIQWLVFST